MKSHLYLTLPLALIISCSPAAEQAQELETVEEIVLEETAAVCIWDKVSVRETPSAKGKWKTSISIGETLTYLGKEAVDSTDDKKYYNVRLADNTEGWSVSDFIIPEGKVAVFIDQNDIYKRPDLLTKTDKKFSIMDIVAIKSTQGDWFEVVGKRSEGKWIESGWIKSGNTSQETLDVAVAKFGRMALEEDNEIKQLESLQEILDNSDFSSSVFIPAIQAKYDELTALEEEMPMMEEADTVATSIE